MPYPPRTKASDAIARNLFTELKTSNIASGGKNRCMVSVVVTGDIDVPTAAYIATSGGAGAFGGLRQAIHNLRGHGIYGGVDYTLVAFHENDNLIRPSSSVLPASATVPILLDNNRDCAEPKALEAAAASGKRLTGMSTFWWGNNANPYPDPSANPSDAGVGVRQPDRSRVDPQVPWALPCDVCTQNQDNIMRRLENVRLSFRQPGSQRASAES